MKALEQLVIRARAQWRTGQARLGGAAKPARLVLRLDDLDAPGPLPAATLTLDGWYDAVVRVVEWTGALPVLLVARADHAWLPDLVRFAHRLECPTTLRTSAAGLTRRRADELVDCGLERVVVRVAGVSEGVQQAVLSESVADTREAIAALLAARVSRGAPLDIELEVPFDPRVTPEFQALHAEARTVGVDGVRIAAPWRGGPFNATALDVLGFVSDQTGPFERTTAATVTALRTMKGDGPGARRTRGSCPVGSLRLEIARDGSVSSCPFQAEHRPLGDAMAPAWQALGAHRAAIKQCDRECTHPDLTA